MSHPPSLKPPRGQVRLMRLQNIFTAPLANGTFVRLLPPPCSLLFNGTCLPYRQINVAAYHNDHALLCRPNPPASRPWVRRGVSSEEMTDDFFGSSDEGGWSEDVRTLLRLAAEDANVWFMHDLNPGLESFVSVGRESDDGGSLKGLGRTGGRVVLIGDAVRSIPFFPSLLVPKLPNLNVAPTGPRLNPPPRRRHRPRHRRRPPPHLPPHPPPQPPIPSPFP